MGFGKQALPQYGEYVAPSPIPLTIPKDSCASGLKIYEGATFPTPRELTTEEVDALIEDYKAAAQRLKACGFDGIELNGCHGYLLWELMSPAHNQRTDKYGGSEEARLNVPLTLLKAVREIGGEDFIVGYRCSSDEGCEGGLTLDDMRRIVPILVDHGADYISLSRGFAGNLKIQYPSAEGTMVEVHSKIKEVSKVPVLSPNISNPATGEKALAEGKVDMIGLSRSLIADPEWPNKVKTGNAHTIIRCMHCNTCLVTLFSEFKIRCAANPNAGWERFDPQYWPPPRIPIPPVKWK